MSTSQPAGQLELFSLPGKKWSKFSSWLRKQKTTALVIAWFITTGLTVGALFVAIPGSGVADSAKNLNEQQSRQIMELQRTTPTGEITGIVPYQQRPSGSNAVKDVRQNPFVPQQINNVSGLAQDVPDNGDLFMVVHNYGIRTTHLQDITSLYYVTPANQSFGTNAVDERWESPGVYIGGASASNPNENYRLSLYFCNSIDSAQISAALQNRANRNAGFSSLPYPSCRQLDGIFIRR